MCSWHGRLRRTLGLGLTSIGSPSGPGCPPPASMHEVLLGLHASNGREQLRGLGCRRRSHPIRPGWAGLARPVWCAPIDELNACGKRAPTQAPKMVAVPRLHNEVWAATPTLPTRPLSLPNLVTPAIISVPDYAAAHHHAGESERARERARETVCVCLRNTGPPCGDSTREHEPPGKQRTPTTLDAAHSAVAASRLRQGRRKKEGRLRATLHTLCTRIRRKTAKNREGAKTHCRLALLPQPPPPPTSLHALVSRRRFVLAERALAQRQI
ncbi:hypothetical protein GGTG_03067 [Gaeumannomyces tritici R3-111a-1]|uniref:Uncharacterized protein n=1 Tax=Gaeumannomyces tritici (strain R3-111a-1) TaxID=644352 RepID=J3NP61_GAET3|nr:hypothetical protein GGTG_03067 [Gaeumannomyces tritici R3-111a-1]EJT77964.1 hypothetical protein GGTG_03067 [Gaeumannomyces tritici R3-111a-1]